MQPLLAPITLLKHYMSEYPDDYLAGQRYFEPYPEALRLGTDIKYRNCMTTHLVWFRNDLRITDNRALHAACEDPQARVIGVFVATPEQWKQHVMAPRQAAFIYQHFRRCKLRWLSAGSRFITISVMILRGASQLAERFLCQRSRWIRFLQ